MRWQGREGSRNVEDRRGSKGKVAAGGLGIGGIIVAVVIMLLGGDPSALLQQGSQAPAATENAATPNAAEEELAAFVSVVLRETELTWSRIF